ncbi:MAG: WcaF family extracellular polysaccharide biosynthesis acetyltransferase [Phycisphaerales bacterium]
MKTMSQASTHAQPDNGPNTETSGCNEGTNPFGGRTDACAKITLDSVLAKPLPTGATIGHFTRSEKIRRFLWGVVQGTVFRYSPRRADSWRAWLLRRFGARVGRVKLLRSTVRVEVPWNIEIGDGAQIGDGVYLYSLGPISIGDHTVVSQFCHLCAGTHDFERTDFPLLRVPIRIGSRCWIAAETFVGPGVTIADGVVVGARSSAIRDLPAWTICVGVPAAPRGKRYLVDRSTGVRLDPHGR